MADEYISREAAIVALCQLTNEASYDYNAGISVAVDAIENFPAADVRPVVRGKWHDWYHVLMPDCYVATCSNCGRAHRYLGMELLNYCPNCGADMREVGHD